VPAALANAVFDATGVRLRGVPFNAGKPKALLA
jgi:CO/xanthine dehydrogenase Mo-binding subunit